MINYVTEAPRSCFFGLRLEMRTKPELCAGCRVELQDMLETRLHLQDRDLGD